MSFAAEQSRLAPDALETSRSHPLTPQPTPPSLLASWLTPSWAFLGLEPMRAALEFAGMKLMSTDHLPVGDGHLVIIFPGMAADASSLSPLKDFCRKLGYWTVDWGRGFNAGPSGDPKAWLGDLVTDVRQLIQTHRGRKAPGSDAVGVLANGVHAIGAPKRPGASKALNGAPRAVGPAQRVTLIGWSLGGFYAREVARALPDEVRQVITIGTPFAGGTDAADPTSTASWLLHLLSSNSPIVDDAMAGRLRETPPVPTTSIYSKSDGVVAWQACLEDPACRHAESIEVESSHLGLGWNPAVLAVIADRLAQVPGQWRRHAPQPTPGRDATGAVPCLG